MTWTRRITAALVASAALAAGGCQSDDAVEQDARDAGQEVRKEAEEAGRDVEKAVPGDADDDGR